jgi:hypothetical protein
VELLELRAYLVELAVGRLLELRLQLLKVLTQLTVLVRQLLVKRG